MIMLFLNLPNNSYQNDLDDSYQNIRALLSYHPCRGQPPIPVANSNNAVHQIALARTVLVIFSWGWGCLQEF